MGSKRCPVCQGDYYNINPFNYYCKEHEEWLVTKCKRCQRYAISDVAGLCPLCQVIDKIIHIENSDDDYSIDA
jgi:rRNA maturation protein Nop10